MKSDTPKTDAALRAVQYGTDRYSFPEFARMLERENNQVREFCMGQTFACDRMRIERDQWRACAERLAASLSEWGQVSLEIETAQRKAIALAGFERLKGSK